VAELDEEGVIVDTRVGALDRTPFVFIRSLVLLAKPGIALSVSLTGIAGMVLAERGFPRAELVILGIGALLLSAAGSSILNNILDKRIDILMKRLKGRVEALKLVGEGTALAFAAGMIAISLFISVYFFNVLFTALIVTAILSYILLYTLYLKRSSPYGTILGGIPGALPCLVGFSAIEPKLGISAWILFIIMMLWQPPHFWALAQVYKSDYGKAGIPVLPVAFGTRYANMLMLIYSISLVPLSLSLWLFGYCSVYYAVAALLVGLYFEYAMIRSVRRDAEYGKAFGASIFYILAIMITIIIDVSLNPVLIVK